MMKIQVAEKIKLIDASPKVVEMTKRVLTIPNPAFHKVARITGSRFAAQAEFRYYKEKDGELWIPRGMRGRLIEWLTKVGEPFELVEDFVAIPTGRQWAMKKGKTLRPHQEPLVTAAVAAREGVISAGTGTGKTLVALEIVRRLGLKALILVPNTVLLDHFYNEGVDYYGEKCGRIGAGSRDANSDVIISTWQSLSADTGLVEVLKEKVGTIVVEEAHGVVSKERMKLLGLFKPRHLYGITATPMRSKDDGRTKAIHFILGNVIGEFKPTMITPTVEVIRTGCSFQMMGTYNEMIDEMVRDVGRNTLIRGLVVGLTYSGKKVMVLTKRVEHYKILQEKLPTDSGYIYVDSEDENRNEMLKRMRDGEIEFKAVFGTVSLLALVTDIPMVDTIILCSDLKSDVLTIQLSGRALRCFEGKTEARIIDLWDNKSPVLKNQFYDRLRVYKAKKWPIVGLDFSSNKKPDN